MSALEELNMPVFEAHEDVSIMSVALGQSNSPLLIIDNAITHPERLIDYAAHVAEFKPVANAGNFYPGIRARMPRAYAGFVFRLIMPYLTEKFDFEDLSRARVTLSALSIVTTPADALSVVQRLPHFDTSSPDQIALLHYLSPADKGGTGFYRHRSTGFEQVTPDRVEPYTKCLEREVHGGNIPDALYANGDTSLFKRYATIDAKFNRLVVYRSNNLHSGNIPADLPLSADPRRARMTINTFLTVS